MRENSKSLFSLIINFLNTAKKKKKKLKPDFGETQVNGQGTGKGWPEAKLPPAAGRPPQIFFLRRKIDGCTP